MKIAFNQRRGFTLIEIMIVVSLIGLLATIAIPNFVRARTVSQLNACINNLRQIDYVKQQWALENRKPPTSQPSLAEVMTYLRQSLVCPSGGATATFDSTYIMNNVATKPTCKVLPDHVLPPDTVSQ